MPTYFVIPNQDTYNKVNTVSNVYLNINMLFCRFCKLLGNTCKYVVEIVWCGVNVYSDLSENHAKIAKISPRLMVQSQAHHKQMCYRNINIMGNKNTLPTDSITQRNNAGHLDRAPLGYA